MALTMMCLADLQSKTSSVTLDKRRSWHSASRDKRTVYFFGYFDGLSDNKLREQLLIRSETDLLKLLETFSGHFMFIVVDEDFTFAATDTAGSCQLLWSQVDEKLYISDNISILVDQLKLSNSDIDKDMALAFSMSGYTIGDRTLFDGVKILTPGHYLSINQHNFSVSAYHKWLPFEPKKSSKNYVEQLSHLNNVIINKLINRANGRKIIVPLSAGCDSRFIVSGLAYHKYDNVLCVSYGKRGNRETRIAKEVSSRLGFRHLELLYTRQLIRQTWHSNEYKDYKDFCDTGTSVHFFGEYPLLKWLRDIGELDTPVIFSNGQSGDFISGNHIDLAFLNPTSHGSSDAERVKKITAALLLKHYCLWMALRTEENLNRLEKILSKQITSAGGLSSKPIDDFGIYEAIEFINRQSKYVLNGLKTYEYFGHEWAVPLWDRDYINFWAKVPLKYKTQQKLYKKTLIAQNWGGVWHDIEINPPSRPSPAFQFIRFLLKAPFLFIGKRKWHEFDRHYFDVFLTPTVGYAMKNYRDIWADKRMHRNPISFYVEEYLNNKRLSWDGQNADNFLSKCG